MVETPHASHDGRTSDIPEHWPRAVRPNDGRLVPTRSAARFPCGRARLSCSGRMPTLQYGEPSQAADPRDRVTAVRMVRRFLATYAHAASAPTVVVGDFHLGIGLGSRARAGAPENKRSVAKRRWRCIACRPRSGLSGCPSQDVVGVGRHGSTSQDVPDQALRQVIRRELLLGTFSNTRPRQWRVPPP